MPGPERQRLNGSAGYQPAPHPRSVGMVQNDPIARGVPGEQGLPLRAFGGLGAGNTQQAMFTGNGNCLAGRKRPGLQGTSPPCPVAAQRLAGRQHCPRQDRCPIGIGIGEACAMVRLEGAQASAPNPHGLILPDGIVGHRWLGHLCQRPVGSEQRGIGADQRVRGILRPAAIGADLLNGRWHWRRCRLRQYRRGNPGQQRQAEPPGKESHNHPQTHSAFDPRSCILRQYADDECRLHTTLQPTREET